MQVDASFEFEKRRNRPVKYDRDLMGQTIVAMQKVDEIKNRRQVRFHDSRQKDAKILSKQQARAELEQSIELLAPAVANRQAVMKNVVDAARQRIAARKKPASQLRAQSSAETMDTSQT